jgi:hypothetical protein
MKNHILMMPGKDCSRYFVAGSLTWTNDQYGDPVAAIYYAEIDADDVLLCAQLGYEIKAFV